MFIRNCILRIGKCIRFRSNFARNITTTKPDESPFRQGVQLVFGKYLLATNTISSGVLMLIGDIFQQEIEFQQQKLQKRYDFGRLTRMFIVGLGLGPVHHYYYVWIAKKWPARTAKIITWKILLDQFIMSPICIAGFFYGMGAMERKSLKSMNEELLNKFKEVYTMDWMVWPPTQFINFYYIPVKYQVIYINAITMLYNVFLSYIKHRELALEQAQQILFLESKDKATKKD